MIAKRFIGMVTAAVLLLVAAPNSVTHAQSGGYVALGDSVAAGAGLPGGDALCGRSPVGYPQIIANDISRGQLTNLSCSGAKIDEGIYGEQEVGNGELASQLDAAFSNGVPSIMTVTIGANDARWTGFIRDCYVWRCGSGFDNVRARAYFADIRLELAWMMYQIERRSGGNPPAVFISGYYFPFSVSSADTCRERDGITADEVSWLRRQFSSLNAAIRSSAARSDFATYVPVNFAGHELCSSDPWVQGLDEPAPFHPTAASQQAIADAFLRYIRR